MNFNDADMWLSGLISAGVFLVGVLLILLALSGWLLTPKGYRTKFGTSLSYLTGSLGSFLIMLAIPLANRAIKGRGNPLEPHWVDLIIRGGMAVTITACLVACGFAYPGMIERFRQGRLQ